MSREDTGREVSTNGHKVPQRRFGTVIDRPMVIQPQRFDDIVVSPQMSMTSKAA